MAATITKEMCEREGKVFRKAYKMPSVCVPKPKQNLSEAERNKIRRWNKEQCERHPDVAYWREPIKKTIKAACIQPPAKSKLIAQSKLMEMWDAKVAENLKEVCITKKEGKMSEKQLAYCRNSANYLRKTRPARGAVSELNSLAISVNNGEMDLKEAVNEYNQYLEKIKIPEISLVDAKLLMDEIKRVKAAKKSGVNTKFRSLSSLRSKYANTAEKRERILKEIKAELGR